MRKALGLGLLFSALLVVLPQCGPTSSSDALNNQETPTPRWSTQKSAQLSPPEHRFDGVYARALLVAYDAFKSDRDIPEGKKQIENYNVELRQSSDLFFITFSAKPLHIGGESELGKDVTYTIEKATYQIVGRNFYK